MLEDLKDDELVVGLQRGDQACVEELTRRYWAVIRRFCATYLHDEALADDVVQETFTTLTTGGDLPTGAVKPWLYKVARNRCLDILRRHQRSPTHRHRIASGFDVAGTASGPKTRAMRAERAALIRDLIAEMPEEYRSVLTFKFYEGLSREEMAACLGVSEQTIKGRIVRASEYLREQLRGITGAPE